MYITCIIQSVQWITNLNSKNLTFHTHTHTISFYTHYILALDTLFLISWQPFALNLGSTYSFEYQSGLTSSISESFVSANGSGSAISVPSSSVSRRWWPRTLQNNWHVSGLPGQKLKAWWLGIVEWIIYPHQTLLLHPSHIKTIDVLKADMPCVSWGEHCMSIDGMLIWWFAPNGILHKYIILVDSYIQSSGLFCYPVSPQDHRGLRVRIIEAALQSTLVWSGRSFILFFDPFLLLTSELPLVRLYWALSHMQHTICTSCQ